MTLRTPLILVVCLFVARASGLSPGNDEQTVTVNRSISAEGKDNVCRQNQFQCNADLCLDYVQLCDGIKDCDDGSDEDPVLCLKKITVSSSRGSYSKGRRLTRQTNNQKQAECGNFDPDTLPLKDGRRLGGPWLPWYALLYYKYEDEYQFICGGTIISSRAIISGATCIWDYKNEQTRNTSLMKVGVGKYELNVLSSIEQNFTVREAHISKNFPRSQGHFASDLSILLLASDIEFNEVIQPICLDFENKNVRYFVPGKSGIVGSWGGKVRDMGKIPLQIHSLPYVNSENCENVNPEGFALYITPDKFCAGIINGTTVCRGDLGGGFATQFRDGKWYLYGIVSVTASKQLCGNRYFFAFTRVPEHYDFIKRHVIESQNFTLPKSEPQKPTPLSSVSPRPQVGCINDFRCHSGECVNKSHVCDGVKNCQDGSDEDKKLCIPISSTQEAVFCPAITECKLPPQPENGWYSMMGCKASVANRETTIPLGAALNYSCNVGYILEGSSLLVCDGGWSSHPPVCTKVSCPSLTDATRFIDCTLNGEDVNCQLPMAPGTTATVKCRAYFENVPTLNSYEMMCQDNGKWNRQLQSCVPKCGVPNPQGVPLISHGAKVKRAEYPWHIALYILETDGSLMLHCGGTIVSSRVIVTAAHCFLKDVSENIPNTLSQYKAVAGKYKRQWDEDSKHVQHLQLEKIIVSPKYKGASHYHANDIAVVVLKHQIRIDEAVRPLCVDFEKSYFKYFSPNTVGTVVGWGLTENQTFSEELRSADLPFVNPVDCEEHTPRWFQDYLTGDKFCAGKNKTVVCKGDSGGGYFVKFSRATRWYLVGVVSIAPTEKCAVYRYAGFTDIYSHIDFIKEYVYKYI